jgi:hypothetical protein
VHSHQIRPDVVRAIGVFIVAHHFDTLKLMREIDLNWPDASAPEIAAAMQAGVAYLRGGHDE